MTSRPGVDVLFSAEQIASRVAELGAAIRAAAGNDAIFLLGILPGAAVFVADLLRAIEGEVSYGFIDVIRDQSDTGTANALEIDFISHTNITDRNVFVVKDVVASGVIESYLLAQLRIHKPRSIRLVALIDRPEQRTIDLTADFKGFEIEGDAAFTGYGLEMHGRGGNLPYLGRASES